MARHTPDSEKEDVDKGRQQWEQQDVGEKKILLHLYPYLNKKKQIELD